MNNKHNSEDTSPFPTWDINIRMIRETPYSCEAVIQARGSSFHLIAGSYQNGNYLCVPSHGFGCDLSHFSDVFWNSGEIGKYLNPVDTISLSYGISYLPEPENNI